MRKIILSVMFAASLVACCNKECDQRNAACCQTCQKVKRTTIRMCQWQECHVAATWEHQLRGQSKQYIARQRIRWGHYSLAKARRA